MNMSMTYPVSVDLTAENRLARWRPLVQWLLAIPHLAIAYVLKTLCHLLTAVSFVTVLFTKRIPRQVYDAIAMTYRYEWRSMSYALALHGTYPPFDFQPSAGDDSETPGTAVNFTYPGEMSRWKERQPATASTPQPLRSRPCRSSTTAPSTRATSAAPSL